MPTKPFGKRKMAIVCGYIGSNYRGLQIDTSDNNFTTVEGEMIKALLAAGFVSESNAVDLSKMFVFGVTHEEIKPQKFFYLHCLKSLTTII